MTTVAGFFCFFHEVPPGRPGATKLAIAYKAPGPLQRGSLDDLVLAMCRGPAVPDALVLLSVAEAGDGGVEAELRGEGGQLAQQRLSGRIALIHAQYSLRSGAVRCTLLDAAFRRQARVFEDILHSGTPLWMDSGLRSVFDPKEVVLQAPPGYAYQKPSGSRSEYFLKPDLGLKSSASVAFIALCVFQRLYARRNEGFAELQTVYVDTMAIAPVAYALRELLNAAGYRGAFNIESFHSYHGLDAIPIPLPRTTLCLISASSSMSMQEQWLAEKRVGRQEVATLLTLRSAGRKADGALLAIDAPAETSAPGPAQLSIRIKGETFLPEQEPAKKVLLTDPHHRSDEEVRLFRELVGTGVFDVFRVPSRQPGKVRALYVDGERLLQQNEFLLWLADRLLQSVKAATRVIVYQEDEASRQLAALVRIFCQQRFGLQAVREVASLALPGEQLESTDGVVVCAAVIGKGSQLLEVSRALRDKHDGPRLYLVGYQVAEYRSELAALRSNLIHSKSVPYEFARYGAAAIGTQLLEFFQLEHDTYYGAAHQLGRLPGLMARRASTLASTHPVNALALLPHGYALGGASQLRPGFAFWPAGYMAQACQPEVLGTMGVLLQRAREDSALPELRRLSSDTFRQVVLNPENFSRFNDGILQGALLRNAYPSELDYRADHAASDFMKALILRTLARSSEQAGEALLEFVLAIALRRLQLVDVHLRELLSAFTHANAQPRAIQDAITFLLTGKGKSRIAPSKLPF